MRVAFGSKGRGGGSGIGPDENRTYSADACGRVQRRTARITPLERDRTVDGAMIRRLCGRRAGRRLGRPFSKPRSAWPMPIQRCVLDIGGGRTRNFRSVGHGIGCSSRGRTCGCANWPRRGRGAQALGAWTGASEPDGRSDAVGGARRIGAAVGVAAAADEASFEHHAGPASTICCRFTTGSALVRLAISPSNAAPVRGSPTRGSARLTGPFSTCWPVPSSAWDHRHGDRSCD